MANLVRLLRRWPGLVCIALTVGLLLPAELLTAGPPGPKPPKRLPPKVQPRTPKARPPAPKPHPPTAKPQPGAKPKVGFVRRMHYWRPYYRANLPRNVWRNLGYTYYVGGTDYVVAPETDSQAATRLEQIQELIEMVHEWRTINESPEVHKRLPGPDSSEEPRSVVDRIRSENQQFDKATRQAMVQLAEARSAAVELESARSHLNELIKLVEALPES